MLIQEILEENPDLIKTYSDANFLVQQVETGDYYAEAIDPIIMHREYIETDIPITDDEEILPPDEEENIDNIEEN